MARYRDNLPQLANDLFITDGGLETTLIFHLGYDLPEFAAFAVLRQRGGYEALRKYYQPYIDLAVEHEIGFILESMTWRASKDWGAKIGYSAEELRQVNRSAIALLEDIRNEQENGRSKMVISGCIGPRGDGYSVSDKMTPEQAEQYHLEQITTLAEAEVDMVSAFTITYSDEAVGITRAAASTGVPVVISFTVETDGRLPSGQSLGEAITRVDEATGNTPAYYMVNCAHPSHFQEILTLVKPWLLRIRGVRANASAKSHAELDEAVTLDDGDPLDFGRRCAGLRHQLPNLSVFGGCCGTDHRHVEKICDSVLEYAA